MTAIQTATPPKRQRANGHKAKAASLPVAVVPEPVAPTPKAPEPPPVATRVRVIKALRDRSRANGLELYAREEARRGAAGSASWSRRDAATARGKSDASLDRWNYTTAGVQKGNGGELTPLPDPHAPARRDYKKHMVQEPPDVLRHQVSADAMDLATDAGVLPAALAMADSIGARNQVERNIAHRAAALHSLGMKLLARSDREMGRMYESGITNDVHAARHQAACIEAARLSNAATRAFAAHDEAMLTLQKLRTGGKQLVKVKHIHQQVQVNDGGKAVVAGNLKNGKKTGGSSGRGRKSK